MFMIQLVQKAILDVKGSGLRTLGDMWGIHRSARALVHPTLKHIKS